MTHGILYFSLYLPNAEITLDLEVNEVEVKGLTSLTSVVQITALGSLYFGKCALVECLWRNLRCGLTKRGQIVSRSLERVRTDY